MGWEGRQLKSAGKNGINLSFTYDSEGIRTSKTVGSTTTKYLLNGTQILAQTTNGTTLSFFYDQQGNRVAMADGNNNFYYYIYNLQGDVIALADASTGKLVVTYTYDAWGKLMELKDTTANSVGTQNPFRYRGYYYDTETSLYYLQSRYYDPDTGRFINADGQLNEGVLGYNMFAYCENNPVMKVDPTGTISWDGLHQFGEECLKAAAIVGGVFAAVAIIGTAVAGTVLSGGAGAIALPAAIAVASECVAVATATTAAIGTISIAAAKIGENGTSTSSTTTWKGKKGKERLDVENPKPGERNGQIHYHEPNNQKHMFDFNSGKFENATKHIESLWSDSKFVKGFNHALKILGLK